MPEENLEMDDIFDNNTPSNSQSTSSNNIKNAASKTTQNVGKTMDAAGKGMQAAGKGAELAGKGVQAAGKAVQGASNAVGGALSAIPVVGTALGGAVKGAGNVAGKGMQTAGKGAEKAGQATQKAGKKASDTGKQIKKTGEKVNNKKGKENKDSNKIKEAASKFGKKNKKSGAKKDTDDKKEKKEEKKNNSDGDSSEGANKDKNQSLGDKIKNKIKNSRIKSDDLKEPAKLAKKLLLKKIKKIIITIFLWLLLICIIIMSVWAFIEEALARLDQAATTIANTHEKFDNFLNGLGFQNSEDAFYDELNKLNKDHNYDLNIPLLMATLFYDDTHSDGDIGLDDSEEDGAKNAIALGIARKWVADKVRESNQTIGADGLAYSSNKIYRLRKLARNQFDNPVFGRGSNKVEHYVSVLEFLKIIAENLGKEFYDYLKSCFDVSIDLFNIGNTAESIYQWLIAGDETFFTTDTGGVLENWAFSLEDLLDAIFSPFFDIGGISTYLNPDCDHVVCVKYYTYGYDEDAYFSYLKKDYIRKMPEFKKYINASTDEIKDKEIDKIIQEIKDTSENYQDVFGKVRRKSSENYSKTCEGNIKESLLGDLRLPVDIPSGHSITFTGQNKFGASGGVMHNGVNLNNTSAGVNQGDNVYSIYDMGEVLESTFDDTYEEKKNNSKLTGSWVKIKYSNISGDEVSDFTITYGGLSNDSLQLKKGDIVQKGDVIGKIGTKEESDGMEESSLYFAFYDNTAKSYLNPVNLFIPCSNGGNTCETFQVHNIYEISESNFRAAINNYCASNNCTSLNSYWNISTAYQSSVDNNLNPMFTVARAFCEGFSPGSVKNNYWGIGCYNGCPSCCNTYGSLSEGISGLAGLRIVSNATSMLDVFSSGYAQLNSTWTPITYNSNGQIIWSGGCEFLDSIKPYLSEEGIAHATTACNTNSGAKVTEEEHKAYYLWNCEKTMQYVKAIFGDYLSSSSDGTYSGSSGSFGVSDFSQSVINLSSSEKLAKIFPNGVPTTESGISPYLTTISVDLTKKDGTKTTGSLTVHKDVAEDVQAIFKEAQAGGFKIYEAGAYSYRVMNNGSRSTLSHHSYGIAIDINVTENYSHDGSTVYAGSFWNPSSSEYSIPKDGVLVNAFKKRGWKWGGDWTGSYQDYMHFSLTGN